MNNTYEASDSFSKVRGNHTLKFGGQYTRFKVKQLPNLVANGTFSFFGSGAQSTGNGFADFLLGLPDNYSQQSSPAFYELSVNAGIFAQDSWRIRSNLTLNYGLRWDYMRPWSEEHNQISTLIYGENSVQFPGAPNRICPARRSRRTFHHRAHSAQRFLAAFRSDVFTRMVERPLVEAHRRSGQNQHSRWRGTILHRHRRTNGRVPDRKSSVWPHVSQFRASAVRAAVRRRADRHSVSAAVSGECSALQRVGFESGCRYQLEPIRTDQRSDQLLLQEPHALRHDRELHRRAPDRFELSGDGKLCRVAWPAPADVLGCESRRTRPSA